MKILYRNAQNTSKKLKKQINPQTQFCDQTKWEILKYEICLFAISFSNNLAQLRRKEESALEDKLKTMESNLNSNIMLEEYNKCKNKLGEIYYNITEGVKVRTEISWYEKGEKSSNLFLNLEKTKPVQGIIKGLEIENKDISDPNEISNEINRFFKNLSAETLQKSLPQVNNFIENIVLPALTQEQKQDCKKEISEKKMLGALKSFSNNKPPGNEGSTKEFHETCWSELKELFMNYSSQIKISKKLITSCRKTVLKLIEEKDKDKRFIINWRPVLLNMDYKIISKIFSDRLKKYFRC